MGVTYWPPMPPWFPSILLPEGTEWTKKNGSVWVATFWEWKQKT